MDHNRRPPQVLEDGHQAGAEIFPGEIHLALPQFRIVVAEHAYLKLLLDSLHGLYAGLNLLLGPLGRNIDNNPTYSANNFQRRELFPVLNV
uniref:Uncharacterized protein n=1 Tax=Tetraselmis sp. GSL018 TaxID=582737 RepID=A0A061RF85_9CHLO